MSPLSLASATLLLLHEDIRGLNEQMSGYKCSLVDNKR